MKNSLCGCSSGLGMGLDPSYWLKYGPGEIYSLLVDKYEITGLLPRSLAVKALDKWLYYFKRGNFKSDPASRLAASEAIASDIFRESSVRPSPNAIYHLLQNANAYLIKEMGLPPKDRGLLTVTKWASRKLKRGGVEAVERVKDAGANVKQAFTPSKWLTSPWMLGVVGALVVASVASNYLPNRRR
jgi:hypothetical protein